MYRTPEYSAAWTKFGVSGQLVPIPSLVAFWPVLPNVTRGTAALAPGGAASSESAEASAAPVAAADWRKRRRLPPQDPWGPSIGLTFHEVGTGPWRDGPNVR